VILLFRFLLSDKQLRLPLSQDTVCVLQDSWQSVSGIIKWYGDHQDEMIPAAGPGHWNDPDMVNINASLSSRMPPSASSLVLKVENCLSRKWEKET